jgi:hypothetical protein
VKRSRWVRSADDLVQCPGISRSPSRSRLSRAVRGPKPTSRARRPSPMSGMTSPPSRKRLEGRTPFQASLPPISSASRTTVTPASRNAVTSSRAEPAAIGMRAEERPVGEVLVGNVGEQQRARRLFLHVRTPTRPGYRYPTLTSRTRLALVSGWPTQRLKVTRARTPIRTRRWIWPARASFRFARPRGRTRSTTLPGSAAR